jgi:AraC-like DNA-binding protein/quercetin dioxygenase-like cupin family protein
MQINIDKVPNVIKQKVSGLATNYVAGEYIARHRHDSQHQIVHASEGVIRVNSDTACWVVPPGRAIWMPVGRSHSIDCYTAVKMRTVYFDQGVDFELNDYAVWSVSALMREIMIRLAENIDQPCQSHLIAILIHEIKTIDVLPLKLPVPDDQRLRRITDTISNNPSDKTRLKDWAEYLGFSKRNLIRRFRAETGMTFRQWGRQARLLSALERLADNQSVTAVALDLGYESTSAFCAAFRKAFGVTPGKYFLSS